MTCVGILGAGQLGRMLALAARSLGLDVIVVDPAEHVPASVAARHVRVSYTDDTVAALLKDCAVVTYEFENVPDAAAQRLARAGLKVFPPPQALGVAQDRVAEKTCFRALGIETAEFRAVDSAEQARAVAKELGLPLLLKTRREGYDGKGQLKVEDVDAAGVAFMELGGVPLIAEGIVGFQRELSLLAVRGERGELAFYPLVENRHRQGVLRVSLSPARDVSPELQARAEHYGARLLEHMGYVGVLALELFQVGDHLLVNEVAPRVHNSGHFSIEGSDTSQFENHLRAVLGWPLGSTAPRGHSGMVNFIGGIPEMTALLAVPGAHVHLYDKSPREGRKVGHVTVTAEDAAGRDRTLAVIETLVRVSERG